MVRSLPARATRALPSGTTSPDVTAPGVPHSSLCSMYTTGSPDASAASNSPWLSAGVDGATTTSPGMCANHASSDWLCCAADDDQMPMGMRITIGTRPWPPNM